MARSVRSNPLETRTNRLKQAIGKRVYVSIAEGLALGYRRPEKGNGTWQARLWTGDKYVKHVLGEADDYLEADGVRVFTFFQAQDKARAYSEEIRRPALPRMKPASVTEASEHYLAWYRENRKAVKETETTIKAHVLPAFGDRLLMDLDTVTIRRWHEKLASSPARKRTRTGGRQVYRDKPTTAEGKRSRKSTANRILTVLKAILNRAFRDGLVADDTAWRRVKPFENADEPVARFLTEAESTRLINACRPDFRNLVKAALFTGARYGELNPAKGEVAKSRKGIEEGLRCLPGPGEVVAERYRMKLLAALEPQDSLGEILFGLIMVLTFTLGASVAAGEDRIGRRTLILGAIGCNVAWGVIDAAFYVMGELFTAAAGQGSQGVKAAGSETAGLTAIRDELDPQIGSVTREEDRETLYRAVYRRFGSGARRPDGSSPGGLDSGRRCLRPGCRDRGSRGHSFRLFR